MAGNERRRLRLVAAKSRRTEPVDALADLAEAAARGERAAVRTFLVSVGPELLRVVRRVLGSEHSGVDDILQESAFAVIAALPRRRREATVLRFASRITLLTALNARRHEAARKGQAAQSDEGARAAPGSVELVLRLLDSLPLAEAEVLGLQCVLGFTTPEIAETADIALETVRSRLRLAEQALRELLGEPRDPRMSKESS